MSLVAGKRVIIAVTRGGLYGAETPGSANEHLETYLKTVFGFIGITAEFVIAEGMLVGPEHLRTAMAQADEPIAILAA